MPTSSHAEPVRRRTGRPAEPLEQRIRRLSEESGDCWLWTRRLDKDGYGRITVNKRPARAHRVSYETFVGPIPEGLELDHLCKVRRCVNPKHLEPVPHLVNVERSVDVGRRSGPNQCVHGHLLDDVNTYRVQGLTQCRECHRKRNREYAARRRAALAAQSGGAS